MLGLFSRRRKTDTVSKLLKVRIAPQNVEFEVKRGANLLDAALQQGIAVSYNCRVGACKTCQVRVLEGQSTSMIERDYVFTREEIQAGCHLACQTRVDSDLVVEWLHLESDFGERAQISKIEKMTPRIYRVQVLLDAPAQWHAGQFAKLSPMNFDGMPRCYSMVDDGKDQLHVSFDITHYEEGAVSSWLVDTANLGKPIKIQMPFGDFGQAREKQSSKKAPLLCIAGGSGVGSISGIIRSLARNNAESAEKSSPIVLIVGARERAEIYGLDALREAADAAQVPLYIDVVLDREPAESLWHGRRGYVAQHLDEILARAAQSDVVFQQTHDAWKVLLCGPPPLVDTAIDALKRSGLHEKQMAFDKYEQQAA